MRPLWAAFARCWEADRVLSVFLALLVVIVFAIPPVAPVQPLETLTTMGYGDITPVHPVARSLEVPEALTGQIYPAILLARLVSLEAQSHG